MASDPFTLIYAELWNMLEAHTGFTGLVKFGNRIKFAGKVRDPLKPKVTADDVPEVRLIAVGGIAHLAAASNGTEVTKRFEVQIASGDRRYDAAMFPVEWEVIRAFSPWLTALRGVVVEWGDSKPINITLVQLTTISEGTHGAESKRGIDGWTAIVAVEVTMWFATADLLPA